MIERALFPLASLALLIIPGASRADVIVGTPQGYTESREFGAVELLTTYSTPDGVPYRRNLGPKYGVTRRAVGWKPKNIPVYVEVGRDARGPFLFMSTLIIKPDGRSLCWAEQPLSAVEMTSPARLWRSIEQRTAAWSSACPTAVTFGAAQIRSALTSERANFRRALSRLVVTRMRFVVVEDGDGRVFGLPSFSPNSVPRSLLEAVADGCDLPRARLERRADGTIVLERRASETSASDCAARAIEYFPGVKRAG